MAEVLELDDRTADALDVVARMKHMLTHPREHLHKTSEELKECCTVGSCRIPILFHMHALIREEAELDLKVSFETPERVTVG